MVKKIEYLSFFLCSPVQVIKVSVLMKFELLKFGFCHSSFQKSSDVRKCQFLKILKYSGDYIVKTGFCLPYFKDYNRIVMGAVRTGKFFLQENQ